MTWNAWTSRTPCAPAPPAASHAWGWWWFGGEFESLARILRRCWNQFNEKYGFTQNESPEAPKTAPKKGADVAAIAEQLAAARHRLATNEADKAKIEHPQVDAMKKAHDRVSPTPRQGQYR